MAYCPRFVPRLHLFFFRFYFTSPVVGLCLVLRRGNESKCFRSVVFLEHLYVCLFPLHCFRKQKNKGHFFFFCPQWVWLCQFKSSSKLVETPSNYRNFYRTSLFVNIFCTKFLLNILRMSLLSSCRVISQICKVLQTFPSIDNIKCFNSLTVAWNRNF